MPLQIDAHPHHPERYADFARRPFAVATRQTFEDQVQFATLRVFTTKDNRLVDWERDLDLYTRELGLGRVVWPIIYTVLAENFPDLVQAIKSQNLWLFDIWGHVPGSAPEGIWAHITPPAGMAEQLRQTLGDRFLGFDNGEQDGRYIGLYATQQCPLPQTGFDQFQNFHRHFRRLGDDMGNQLSVLTSLQFIHHFAREGNHLLLGAETAQALPNSQVYYSFIRGAGKQHGLLWFGNASVFNRWGYKSYEGEGEAYGMQFGPEHGTSLSLLRRLLYSHILYGCSIVGFENNWVLGDDNEKRLRGEPVLMQTTDSSRQLSPIGEIQAAAVQWANQYGDRGTMLTPVGLLLDVFSGWTVPRHLYVPQVYQTWGGRPYNDGDHLTHALFSLLYPNYEDSGYFRNERGFMAATPFGDIADTLLSDAPAFVLKRYATIICAGAIQPDDELRDKLKAYVEAGGHAVLTSANSWLLDDSLGPLVSKPIAGGVINFGLTQISEQQAFQVALPINHSEWTIVAEANGVPVVLSRSLGNGQVTLLLSDFGLADAGPNATCPNEIESPLPALRPLLAHARYAFESVFRANQMVEADPNLTTILCRRPNGNEYTLGLFNNGTESLPLAVTTRLGRIASMQELPVSQAAVGTRGYWPSGVKCDGTANPQTHVAAGDVRIFSLRIEESSDVTLLPEALPPSAPRDRFISLRGHADLSRTLLGWPTFFQHFDGAKLDWTYLRDRDPSVVEFEAAWVRRQSMRVLVDFSTGLNFYPDLTLLDTFAPRYEESIRSIENVLRKAAMLGAEGIIFSLHRMPENHCDAERASARFVAGAKRLVELVRNRLGPNAGCYLTHHPSKWIKTLEEAFAFADVVGEGVQVAWHLGHETTASLAAHCPSGKRIGMVLAASPITDSLGQWYDAHAPARQLPITDWRPFSDGKIPVVLDSTYMTWNEAYRDARAIFAASV